VRWVRLDLEDESDEMQRVLAAAEGFTPVDPTRESDQTVAKWLELKAWSYEGEVWFLLEGTEIAAFHTAIEDQCRLGEDGFVSSLHVQFAARSATHPGVGRAIVEHFLDLAGSWEKPIVTLDPFDASTAEVWRRHGFIESLTPTRDYPDPEYRMFLRAR
jgi:hypothetical protein